MERRRLGRVIVAVAFLPVVACSSGIATDPQDAFRRVDAGATKDAGGLPETQSDAGTPIDAGAPIDAGGLDADAGGFDAGPAGDAGVPDERGDDGGVTDSGIGGDEGIVATFSGTTSDFANPERGFYGWSGDDLVSSYDSASVQASYDAGMRLVLAKVQLDSFRDADVSSALLNALGDRFASLRSAGMKVTLLLSYDFSAEGRDATATVIQRHLEQLKPVLAANADVIPFMRAGFIGAWGEWHSSTSGNSCGFNSTTSCETANANRLVVRDALLANVPPTTQIGFRSPSDLQSWYASVAPPPRLGAHNDCFLSGPTDTGTYTQSGQREFVQGLTITGAFGGETCDGETPLRTSCADILAEGVQYHLAWLNKNYSPTFITAWAAGGCLAEVSRSMGYRLQLDAIAHRRTVVRGGTFTALIDLRNVGWARLFSARKLVVTLEQTNSGGSGAVLVGAAGDLSTLPAQATSSSRIIVSVAIPSTAQSGDYDVLLSVPDVFAATAGDVRFAVRPANADDASVGQSWDGVSGRFKTGTRLSVLP